MKKFIVYLLTVLITVNMLFVFGCGDETVYDVNVFSMDVTEKVLKDLDYSEFYKNGANINIIGAKNEYESAQIIFNASKDVKNFTVETADLYCGENKFDKSNVKVFNQKYVKMNSYSLGTIIDNEKYPLGDYPDPLVPMEVSEDFGENVAEKGKNQGIWFSFYIPKDIEMGTYTGTFVLKTDGVSTNISVSVTVMNFELDDTQHLKTIFTTTQEWLIQGELDNTDEMYERYVDQLLEYRISTFDVPYASNLENYISYIKKVSADERFSAFGFYTEQVQIEKNDFPLKPDGTTYGIENSDIDYRLWMFDEDVLEEYVLAMIENSTPELNLFKKATLYFGTLDEAHAYRIQENCKWLSMRMIDCLIVIANEYGEEALAEHGLTKGDIIGLDMLFTIPYFSECDGMRGYCPLINEFSTDADRSKYNETRENSYAGYNGEAEGYSNLWWYFCNNPSEPYPNFHIDGSLMGGRLLGWMSYDYGMDGLLTWATSCYLNFTSMEDGNKRGFYEPRPAYTGLQTGALANGDGFLVYPGKKYDLNGFIPSIRLMTIRDGLEDYEYLYKLNELVEQSAKNYGLQNYDVSVITDNINNLLYSGLIFKADKQTLDNARKEIGSYLELLSSDVRALIDIGKRNPSEGSCTVSIYTTEDVTCKINGIDVSSQPCNNGLKFIRQVELNQDRNYVTIELEKNGHKITTVKNLGGKMLVSDAFVNGANDWYTVDLDDYSPVSLSMHDNKLKVECEINSSDNLFYVPGFGIAADKIFKGNKLLDVNTLFANIYNDSEFEIEIEVSILFSNGKKTVSRSLSTVKLQQGDNEIKIQGFDSIAPDNPDYLPSKVVFGLKNTHEINTSLLVSDIYIILGD